MILAAGVFDGNAGFNAAANRYLRPAENVTVFGYVGVQDTADRFTCEDVYLTHALAGAYVPFGRKGGCTAAFMIWGRKGRTVRDLVFRRCTAEKSYHHGFSMNLVGAQEGGGSRTSSSTSATRSAPARAWSGGAAASTSPTRATWNG